MILLKTPWGYIDLLHTWEGWTLIGAVLMALAVLAWWMEWEKVKCWYHEFINGINMITGDVIEDFDCPACHGTGRVRRRWISKLLRRK